MKKLLSVSLLMFFYPLLHAQNITALQAKNYVGKTMQVCDIIKEATLDNISKDGRRYFIRANLLRTERWH